MDDRMDAVKAELEAVSFVGETLAPFFLQDPRTGTAGAAFQAVAQLRAQEAADAWPFAYGAEARHAMSLMVNGLADGI
ncbi:MAG: Tat proofreading chaperone DmsD, partial [Eggerthella lenta]